MFRKYKQSVKEANETTRSLINDPGFISGQSDLLETVLREANERARSLINDPGFISGQSDILERLYDDVNLEALLTQARYGQEFWNSLEKLRAFMNETGFSQITLDITSSFSQKQELFRKLETMKKSLQTDYDDLQKYDQHKTMLTDQQKQLLEVCKSKLLGEDDWKNILEQEFYLHWIQFIEKDNQVLKMQPFETYIDNCKRLSAEVRNHRDLTKLNISRKIEKAILRPIRTSSGRRSFRNNPELLMWTTLVQILKRKDESYLSEN